MVQESEDGISSTYSKRNKIPNDDQADADPLLRSLDQLILRLRDVLETGSHGPNRHSSVFQACLSDFSLPGELSPSQRGFSASDIGSRTVSKDVEQAGTGPPQGEDGIRPSQRVKPKKKRRQVNAMPLLEEEEYEALADARSKQRAMRTAEKSEPLDEDAAPNHTFAQRLVAFVSSKYFEGLFAAVIITNCVFLGISLEVSAQDLSATLPSGFKVVDYIYSALFALELILKIAVQGQDFFCARADRSALFWNYLDLVIVGTSAVEMVFDIILAIEVGDSADLTQTRLMRSIRIVRVLRVMRVIKVVKFISALTSLVSSILSTLKSLLWSLVLLLMVMYVFAILFTDTVIGHVQEVGQGDQTEVQLLTYFGSLHLSMHTLFRSVTGGLDWGEMADLLVHIDWAWGYFFTGYIAFSYFAVLNVITAVFCQRAIESAEQDGQNILQRFLDDERRYKDRIEHLFTRFDGLEKDGAITLSEMEQFFNDEEVRAMFQSLDLTARDSWTLFKLLDENSNGDINLDEFMDGCLRLRGPAKALDIASVMDESRRIKRKVMITEDRIFNLESIVNLLPAKLGMTDGRPRAPTEDPPLLSSGPGGLACRGPGDGRLSLPDVPYDVGPNLDLAAFPLSQLAGRRTAMPDDFGRARQLPDVPYDSGPLLPLKQMAC